MKAWVRLDADVLAHPKFAGMSAATFRIWFKGLAHCRQFRTDGVIAAKVVSTIASKRQRAELVSRELWHERPDGGVDVHDYGERQLTEAQWQARSGAGKKAAAARWDAERIRNASETNARPMPTDSDTDTEKKPLGGDERRDEVWDTLARISGPVTVGTSPHGRRNKVASELRKMRATAETIEAVCDQLRRQWPDVKLTDTALSKHYQQTAHELKPKGKPPCDECELGGGHHLPTCSHA
jgi:hypothetical protein